eukprot:70354_1
MVWKRKEKIYRKASLYKNISAFPPLRKENPTMNQIQKMLAAICLFNVVVNYVLGPILTSMITIIPSSMAIFIASVIVIVSYIAFSSSTPRHQFKSTYLKLINRIRNVSRSHLEHWQDPEIVEINTIQCHTPLRLLDNKKQALLAVEQKRGQGDWNMFLATSDDPTKCEFKLYDNPLSVDLNNTEWHPISLPSNWQIEFPDKDPPIYTNLTFPWKRRFLTTDVPCKDNPTGLYRIPFRISKEWFDLIKNGTRELFLIFDGAGSGIDIYVNGKHVGYGQDSMTETEVNITNADLREGQDNIMHCIVYRWTDGSYMEDQDQWWLSGIFRDVELQCRLRNGGLQDYVAQCDANGTLKFEGTLTPTNSNVEIVEIELELYDESHELVHDHRSRVDVKSDHISAIKSVRMQMENCHLWNVQNPYLYTLVISVYHDNSLAQVESTRVGFRSVEIKNGQVLVNNEAILVCGVNRHEFDAKLGKVMQEDMMMQDIRLMKQFNFNAVRSCHYPNVHRWYELCDQYGLFVVDEANIETHGFARDAHISLLQHDDHWKHAFLKRCQAMVLRARNHVCIIGWSLGNESGCGPNMRHCAKWIRSIDPTRTVQYEGGIRSGDSPLILGEGRDPYCTDIICPMYDSPLRCAEVVDETKNNPSPRPFILCEYAHAMGNSSGNLHLYWNLFRSKNHPRLQGGFIWDWVDQGLCLHLQSAPEFGYGGDFGPTSGTDDTTFCINGMVFPDRMPHPAMYEAKYLMQPITFNQIADDRLQMEMFSHCPSVEDLQFHWFVYDYKSSKPIDTGKCTLDPSNNQLTLVGCSCDASTFMLIQASFNKNMAFVNANHIVATQVFQPEFHRLLIDNALDKNDNVEFTKRDDASAHIMIISCPKYIAKFDMEAGRLMSFAETRNEGPLLNDLTHSFFRAPTDNDLGGLQSMAPVEIVRSLLTGDKLSLNAQWRKIGLDRLKSTTTAAKMYDKNTIIVKQQHKHGKNVRFTTSTRYLFQNDGVKLDVKVEADSSTLSDALSLPRIGMQFVLPPEFEQVQYLGCGPHESYPDRKASSIFGVHETTVSAMHVPYILPTENGGRSDVQWVQFQSNKNKNKTIRIQYAFPENAAVGKEFFDGDDLSQSEPKPSKRPSDMKGAQFSASRYSVNDLTQAKHQCELPDVDVDRSPIYVHMDTAHQGLGGDNSWTPTLHDQYRVHAKSWNYTLTFKVL